MTEVIQVGALGVRFLDRGQPAVDLCGLRVRLDLPKPFDLLSEMSNSLQSPFEFLVASNH